MESWSKKMRRYSFHHLAISGLRNLLESEHSESWRANPFYLVAHLQEVSHKRICLPLWCSTYPQQVIYRMLQWSKIYKPPLSVQKMHAICIALQKKLWKTVHLLERTNLEVVTEGLDEAFSMLVVKVARRWTCFTIKRYVLLKAHKVYISFILESGTSIIISYESKCTWRYSN